MHFIYSNYLIQIPDTVPGKPEIEVIDIKECNDTEQENATNIKGDKWAIAQKVPICFEIDYQCRRICLPFYDLDISNNTCSGIAISFIISFINSNFRQMQIRRKGHS